MAQRSEKRRKGGAFPRASGIPSRHLLFYRRSLEHGNMAWKTGKAALPTINREKAGHVVDQFFSHVSSNIHIAFPVQKYQLSIDGQASESASHLYSLLHSHHDRALGLFYAR